MECHQNTEEKEEKLEFKKPVLVGRIGKLPKKAKPHADKPPEPTKDEESANKELCDESSESKSSKSSLPPAVLLKEISTPIPYKEPKWSGLCPDGELIEQLFYSPSTMLIECKISQHLELHPRSLLTVEVKCEAGRASRSRDITKIWSGDMVWQVNRLSVKENIMKIPEFPGFK